MNELHRPNWAYKLYHVIQGSPHASLLVSRMFEISLHPYMKTRTYTITPLELEDRERQLNISFTPNTVYSFFGAMRDFSGQLASSAENHIPCYLQPSSPVFPSFDSFLYQPVESESAFSHLIALQVTTSDNHAISIKGLEKIQTVNSAQTKSNCFERTATNKCMQTDHSIHCSRHFEGSLSKAAN